MKFIKKNYQIKSDTNPTDQNYIQNTIFVANGILITYNAPNQTY